MKRNSEGKTEFGLYDEKGYWHPPYPCTFSPLFRRPATLKAILKYLFGWGGYLWPRNVFYVALAVVTWFFLQAGPGTTSQLSVRLVGFMLLRNIALMWCMVGFYHLLLYTFKVQGNRRKYNPKWLEKGSRRFLFKDQLLDNMFMSTVSGGLIWTAYEVFYIWAASNRLVPMAAWSDNPIWFVAFFLIIPVYRESHFYFIHRLIHWKPLLRSIHHIHHKNPNPGPWSGLSMHPVEHLLYFSVLLIHFVVPSHPIHFFYDSQLTALTPATGHDGFEGPLLGGLFPAGDYFHYLHHRFVSCNFGTATVPWDRWLGNYYNGEGPYRRKHATAKA
jgi:sterol desaturase/sphingolipid hydroxylase (fatty acid hydroxylase superfamily)